MRLLSASLLLLLALPSLADDPDHFGEVYAKQNRKNPA